MPSYTRLSLAEREEIVYDYYEGVTSDYSSEPLGGGPYGGLYGGGLSVSVIHPQTVKIIPEGNQLEELSDSEQAGLEETLTHEPLMGASAVADLGGTARSFPEMALRSYLKQEGVVPALERSGGLLRLSAEQAGRLLGGQIQRWGEAVKGAFLVRGSDSENVTLRADQLIFADSDLSNPRLDYVWTKVGPDWTDLEGAMPIARRGDLLLGEEQDVTPDLALNALRARFRTGDAPVVILGTQERIYDLSKSDIRVYQDLALEVDGEPEVWVLSVSVRLEERAGETYHLIIRL